MTLRDFNRLSEAAKNEVISLWGDYLEEKVVPGFQVTTYKIDGFYVEVYYDHKQGIVKKIRGCLRTDA